MLTNEEIVEMERRCAGTLPPGPWSEIRQDIAALLADRDELTCEAIRLHAELEAERSRSAELKRLRAEEYDDRIRLEKELDYWKESYLFVESFKEKVEANDGGRNEVQILRGGD